MNDDDLHRQFEALIGGADLEELRRLTGRWLMAVPDGYSARPELRKQRRGEPVLYRIRAELNDSKPVIWRQLEVRSDLTLDSVHSILQGAFSWTDSHLHRFSLGGSAFDPKGQWFLCPYDAQEGVGEGIPTDQVRLDETMTEPGDVLDYVYDYGDNWDLTLRLEAVLPLTADAPVAACVDGQRAAPPENCGALRTEEELARILADPAHFDLAEANRWLVDPLLVMRQSGVREDLIALLRRLRPTRVGEPLERLGVGLPEIQAPTQEEFDEAMRPVRWFLERAAGEGIALTSAGYLKPADVEAAAKVVPMQETWYGKLNREVNARQVLRFRQALQKLGLLRKSKGRLLLTKAGTRGLADPGFLWGHMASRLVPESSRFDREATLVILLCATSGVDRFPETLVTTALNQLGWRMGEHRVRFHEVRWATWVVDVIANLSPVDVDSRDWSADIEWFSMGPVVRALASEALLV